MEQSPSLFSLGIDPTNRGHLSEAARWARFLAVVGMIFLGLATVFVIFGFSLFNRMLPMQGSTLPTSFSVGYNIGMIVWFVIWFVLSFIPLLFLLRFANHLKVAILAEDQEAMTVSFLNLKRFFRYIGIFTLIMLIFYALIVVIALVGASMR